jgi:RNA binding exosome subunit
VAHFFKQYNKIQNFNTNLERKEMRTLKQIKEKFDNKNTLFLKLDKGNSVIIIYRNTYNEKSCISPTITNLQTQQEILQKKFPENSQGEYQ